MSLVIEPGEYTFHIGASSTDIRLKSTVKLEGKTQTLSQKDIFFSELIVN